MFRFPRLGLFALVVCAWLVSACGDGALETTAQTSKLPVAKGSWQEIPEAHRPNGKGLGNLSAVQFGDELVVVAGSSSSASTVKGHAYDMREREWRRLPESPLSWRSEYSIVKAQDDVIVWGGAPPLGGREGARYQRESDSWRPLAPSPLAIRAGQSAVWTGKAMILWGGETDVCGGPTLRDGAAYDLTSDSWRKTAKAPIPGRVGHAAIWTGEEMIVWGGSADRSGSCEPVRFLDDGAAYDPASDTWRPIADAPITSGGGPEAFWTGREMLVWGMGEGAAYSPRRDRWRMLPNPPIELPGTEKLAWSGRKLFVLGEEREGEGAAGTAAAYHPSRNRWTILPPAGLTKGADKALIWARRSLFVLSPGCCGRHHELADGARYVPAPKSRVGTPAAGVESASPDQVRMRAAAR